MSTLFTASQLARQRFDCTLSSLWTLGLLNLLEVIFYLLMVHLPGLLLAYEEFIQLDLFEIL